MVSSTDDHEILRLRRDFDLLYAEWKQILLEYSSRKFSPLQPRKPPGPGEGQWTSGGGPARLRVSHPTSLQRLGTAAYLLESDAGRHAWGGGVDPAQALLSALQMIGAELYTSDQHRSDALMWLSPHRGYGFPVPQIIRDLLVGDDKKFL